MDIVLMSLRVRRRIREGVGELEDLGASLGVKGSPVEVTGREKWLLHVMSMALWVSKRERVVLLTKK